MIEQKPHKPTKTTTGKSIHPSVAMNNGRRLKAKQRISKDGKTRYVPINTNNSNEESFDA